MIHFVVNCTWKYCSKIRFFSDILLSISSIYSRDDYCLKICATVWVAKNNLEAYCAVFIVFVFCIHVFMFTLVTHLYNLSAFVSCMPNTNTKCKRIMHSILVILKSIWMEYRHFSETCLGVCFFLF